MKSFKDQEYSKRNRKYRKDRKETIKWKGKDYRDNNIKEINKESDSKMNETFKNKDRDKEGEPNKRHRDFLSNNRIRKNTQIFRNNIFPWLSLVLD